MFATLGKQWICRGMACAVFVLTWGLAATMADAALPSTVTSRMRTVNTALDQVDKALEAKQLTTAQRRLIDAQRIQKEIQDRYAGKFDETDPTYKAMVERLTALTTKVQAEEKAVAGAEVAGKEANAANEALCKQWIGKFGPFLDHKSDQYLRIGSDLNTASPADQAKSKAAYAKVKDLFAEYQKVQFPKKTAELANVESQLVGAMKYYAHEEAGDAQGAACKEWEDRLGPYVEVGRGSPKRLIASPTANAEQVKTQQALFEEAKKLFDDYKKAEFPKGKTQRLQGIEEQMNKTLEEFPKAMAKSQTMMSGDIDKRLDAVLAHFNRDSAWKTDATKNPPTIMERDLKPLREEVDRYAGTAKADDPKLTELRGKLKTIESADAENRAVWARRTFQKPDGYMGSDLASLKEKAKAVAAAAHPKGEVPRVTVPSKDWAIEDVIEATDTTNTALRHRITRSVRAQVVVKDAAGTVWLQEVYLGQDKKPDGGWADVKGHTTWADRMAPDNVGKTGQ